MPTGYTHCVQDGSVTEFREFALRCARGMGACVMLRDDPLDDGIPETLPTEGEYHTAQINELKQRLGELRRMSLADAEKAATKEYDDALKRHREYLDEKELQRQRYEAMLAEVDKWIPPTDDHRGLKDFMVSQLRESINFDCSTTYVTAPVPAASGAAWLSDKISDCERDLKHHAEERAKQQTREASRQAWVDALRASLTATQR